MLKEVVRHNDNIDLIRIELVRCHVLIIEKFDLKLMFLCPLLAELEVLHGVVLTGSKCLRNSHSHVARFEYVTTTTANPFLDLIEWMNRIV